MQEDRKLAITIAVVLGAGVVGVAGLSMLGRNASRDEVPVAESAIDRGASATVAPASVPKTAEAVPLSAGTPEEAAEFQVEPGANYLARGIEAYQAKQFDHAIAYLLADVEEHPDRPYSQYLLGLSLWKAGRLDEAVDAMQRSADLDPGSIKTFVNLARIQNERGDYDAALTASWSALELNPEDAAALFLEGRSLQNLGEQEPAIESLRHSLEIDPDNPYVWNMLGLSLLALDRNADAVTAFETAAGIDGDIAYVQNNLGMALELDGRAPEAVAAYRRAVEIGGHARAEANLARLEPTLPAEPEVETVGVADLEPAATSPDGSK